MAKESKGNLKRRASESTAAEVAVQIKGAESNRQTDLNRDEQSPAVHVFVPLQARLSRGKYLNGLIWAHAQGTLADSPSFYTGFNRGKSSLEENRDIATEGDGSRRTKAVNAHHTLKKAEHISFHFCLCLLP